MNLAYIADCLLAMKTPVQLVKHFDEVVVKNITYPLIGQIKYDGVYCLLVKSGDELQLFSRVGKPLYMENLQGFMQGKLHNLSDGVYIGELCADNLSLEALSGYISPNRKKPWDDVGTLDIGLQGYIMFHDYLTIYELLDGCSVCTYEEREVRLRERLLRAELDHYRVLGRMFYNRVEADTYAETLIHEGHEGAVFKHPNADWVAGHKGWRVMKIVRGVHLDLLCCGVVYGKGKRAGQIAALEFTYKGHKFKADLGKGWTDERRKELTTNYELTFDPHTTHDTESNPIGKIWELKALDISSTGKALHLPKVVRIREDKELPDA